MVYRNVYISTMTLINKPAKKLQKLKFALKQLDDLRNEIINVIEKGGDIEYKWENTGLQTLHGLDGFTEVIDNGSRIFTFRIPPHKIK